ncbi:hypothetical protein EJF36_09005 [Bacillus sp. HMF5848]|uniref:hypothetical protein n=1 Tax=Bacillus sp. HMF5848 TaxID=2495421 RepID=UPI000F795E9F|nr:hypothetical protein [Bacillus sp. HMF5848]RSK26999.1 hypothetical protein EJF36_09005 [Bacillus sp. HMF5848]
MEQKNYETRHIFLAISICTLVATPFFFILIPKTAHNMLFFSTSTWLVQTPKYSYTLFALGGFFLALGFFFVYLFHKQQTKIVISVFVMIPLTLLIMSLSINHYQYMGDTGVAWSSPFSYTTSQYSWDDVERIEYVLTENYKKEKSRILIMFKDGNSISFVSDNVFREKYWKFRGIIAKYSIPFIGTGANANS